MGARVQLGAAVRAAVLALVLGLAGCASAPDEVVRPDVEPPGGWWDAPRWHAFLAGWSAEAIAILRAAPPARLTPREREVLARGTLAYPPASEAAIAALEGRVGRPLPPSYVAFLRASDGWMQVAMDAADGRVWDAGQVQWFRDQEPGWLRAWTLFSWSPDAPDATYFDYGPRQDPVHLRRSYLPHALAISEGIDAAIYLLNPRARNARGEWEAWLFGNALPGAMRYRSFQELMAAERPRVLTALRQSHPGP